MRTRMRATCLMTFGVAVAMGMLVGGIALAQATWVDEIVNSVAFYKTNYPGSNWEPYQQSLTLVREAVSRGDQRIVRNEMGKFFKMLQGRAHGINDVAADELFNFAVMVTPIQEFNIAVPAPAGGGF
ncbi:MAG: hypothetical protein KGN30_12700 [Nitrospirota bacterium]|nr:hypothetical protein [Nitrospirota bacterium]